VGKKNIVADALSRRADHHMKLMKKEVMVKWLKKWEEAYEKDENFKAIWKRKESSQYEKKEHVDRHFSDYRRKGGLLWKKERICVPKSKKAEVKRKT
jgi:hypothetical protein